MTPLLDEPALEAKLERTTRALRECERAVVAFSGGVDSTLLAALARQTLGKDAVLAVTADSPSMARRDLDDAQRFAQALDLQHAVIRTDEVDDPLYQANTSARCYVCKFTMFQAFDTLARQRGYAIVLYGAIGEDQWSERPGQRAALECGVRAPLQDAGLRKWEVRQLARRIGLPNWDRPQNACLASRIPHGSAVSRTRLRQIEQAETSLHEQGFRQVRVRLLGRHARIEVGQDEVSRFHDPQLCLQLARQMQAIGFLTVGVSRSGYQPGGADQAPDDEVPLEAV